MNQLISLVSVPPGNILYHLVTLFALQVVFAIAYSFGRLHKDDEFARRLSWAAAGIIGARLLLLLISLVISGNSAFAVVILPPLETAVNTATAILLTWSLLPHNSNSVPLSNTAVVTALSITSVLLLFSIPVWQNQIAAGMTNFQGTLLLALWSLIQITILAGGLAFVLRNQSTRQSLRPFILGILILAHLLQLWNTTNFNAFDTNITYWVRLGTLIALPLWAVLAYQYVISSLIATTRRQATAVDKYNRAFQQAASVIAGAQPQQRINHSLNLAAYLLDASFVAIGMPGDRPQELKFVSNLNPDHTDNGRRWKMNLSNWTTFRLAASQAQLAELRPDGLGAQQLRDFYGTLGLEPQGAILAHPLIANGQQIGLFLAVAPPSRSKWSNESRLLLPGLATYMAQAIANSLQRRAASVTTPPQQNTITTAAFQHQQEKLHQTELERVKIQTQLADAKTQLLDTENEKENLQTQLAEAQTRLLDTEIEKDKLRTQLAKAQIHIQEAEERAAALKERARKVAATITDAKKQARTTKEPPPRIQFVAPPPMPKLDSGASS